MGTVRQGTSLVDQIAMQGDVSWGCNGNIYAKKKFDDVNFNVDGTHPAQFNIDRYNEVIAMDGNTQYRLDLLNSVIGEVDGFAKEYNRQSIYHADRGDYTNSAIAASWRKTAIDVLGELMTKKNALVKWMANPRNQLQSNEVGFNPDTSSGINLSGGLGTGNTGNTTDTGTDTNTLPDEGLSSGMMWGIGIALALAIAIPLGVAYKNKNKGK